jgi:hypothetical protein
MSRDAQAYTQPSYPTRLSDTSPRGLQCNGRDNWVILSRLHGETETETEKFVAAEVRGSLADLALGDKESRAKTGQYSQDKARQWAKTSR